LTPQQVSNVQKELSNLEAKLSDKLRTLDLKDDNLELVLIEKMKKQEMNRDEVVYASLIVDSITLKLEIRTIKV